MASHCRIFSRSLKFALALGIAVGLSWESNTGSSRPAEEISIDAMWISGEFGAFGDLGFDWKTGPSTLEMNPDESLAGTGDGFASLATSQAWVGTTYHWTAINDEQTKKLLALARGNAKTNCVTCPQTIVNDGELSVMSATDNGLWLFGLGAQPHDKAPVVDQGVQWTFRPRIDKDEILLVCDFWTQQIRNVVGTADSAGENSHELGPLASLVTSIRFRASRKFQLDRTLAFRFLAPSADSDSTAAVDLREHLILITCRKAGTADSATTR